MAILRLDVTNFRNLKSLRMEPISTGFNIIYGLNGSGKTSLLEAIHYLTYGRSFRTALPRRIINHTAENFQLFGMRLVNENPLPVGMERTRKGEFRIRCNGEEVTSVMQLASMAPLLLINMATHQLLEAGPLSRRKYIDWGSFYGDQNFLDKWRQYRQVLSQRNAALRKQVKPAELSVWTDELISRAQGLVEHRMAFIEKLQPVLEKYLAALLPGLEVSLEFYAGWNQEHSLAEVLHSSLGKDLAHGYTHYGPHRADLHIKINKTQAKDILSRGQQKLFICAMMLAQGAVLKKYNKMKPIYLIDDLPAELDRLSKAKLLELLALQETQVFITGIERELFEGLDSVSCRMFHVEHGIFTKESV